MTRWRAVGLLVLLGLTVCARPPTRQYELRGQVLAVDASRREIMIKHDDIPGYMPGMTMAFKVRDPSLLDGRIPGDLVSGTLVVTGTDAYLGSLRKIGHAEVAAPTYAPAASSGFELLKTSDVVPEASFVDQDGRSRRLSEWRGAALALTFIYTRCPFPTFCPLMDRHFAAIQDEIARDPMLRDRVRLLSVSFDPTYDTPPVLKRHAESLKADPAIWSFVTGERDAVDQFAARFGVTVARNPEDPLDISHTLRTAVIDAGGRLVTIYRGNEWTPAEVLRDLRALRDSR